MKRLEISRLMDEYQDNEFFPEGGSTADPEAVKGWVLANAKPVNQRKQAPKKRKVLIAAALAAVLVVLVGAGLPYMRHNLVGGALIFEQTGDGGMVTGLVHYGSPVVKVEDNRILFKQDGDEYLDITGLINEDTSYIYDGSDPNTGSTYYVIIGGTPENCGYLEWITAPSPFDGEDGAGNETVYAFEWVTSEQEPGARFFDSVTGFHMPVQLGDGITPSWLLAGLNELGIPYEYAPSENLG